MRTLELIATGADADRAAPVVRDVIFTFSYVTWNGARRRGMNMAQDRLAQTLLTHPRVRRLIVADPWSSAPRRLASRALGREEPFPDRQGAFQHRPLRLRRFDPTSIAAIDRSYKRYDAALRRAAERHGLDRPVVVTMHPLIGGFCPFDWAGDTTFYASDDWSAAPEYAAWHDAYREGYRRIRESRRAVCAVSQPILDRIGPTGPSIVVPNGLEPREWEPSPAPLWFSHHGGPRLLYVGTLDTRLDVPVIRALAGAFPHAAVTLAGTLAVPEHFEPLRGLPNVRIVPRQSRDVVGALCMSADVCLIPHAVTPFTTAMSPLKVYEYLGAGKPVVATDLPPLRGISDRVTLVDDEGWVRAVESALAAPPQSEEERREFVARNSWSRRHERVLDFVMGATG